MKASKPKLVYEMKILFDNLKLTTSVGVVGTGFGGGARQH
jgi:hypothetical protein